MTGEARHRASDRLITPAVVCVFLLVAGGLVALVVVATAWLTARGQDPEPLVRLVASLIGAATGLGTFLLQLTARRQHSRTERNTGLQANELGALADVVDELVDRVDVVDARVGTVAAALPRPRAAAGDTVAHPLAPPALDAQEGRRPRLPSAGGTGA